MQPCKISKFAFGLGGSTHVVSAAEGHAGVPDVDGDLEDLHAPRVDEGHSQEVTNPTGELVGQPPLQHEGLVRQAEV